MSALRRKFTSEFKQEAVALVQRSGRSANQVAQELGVSQTALSHWLREATRAASGPNGFQAAEELTALRREVERLRIERDYPKKGGSLLRQRVAMRYAFIQAEKAQYPVPPTATSRSTKVPMPCASAPTRSAAPSIS